MNNPYNENPNGDFPFSESYFDYINDKLGGLAITLLKTNKVSPEILFDMLPLDPEFKLSCNPEQVIAVLQYIKEH